MKRLLLILLLTVSASGQRAGLFTETLSAAGVGTGTIASSSANATTYQLVYSTGGTSVATLSIQIEGSVNGVTYATCGSASTATTANQINCFGYYKKVRANLTVLTGSSPTVTYSLTSNAGAMMQGQQPTGTTFGANNPFTISGVTLASAVVPVLVNTAGSVSVALDTSTPGANLVAPSATASSGAGCTPTHLISAATTNATSVKASAGQLYSVVVTNVNASARFLKFYDKASAPTCNSDTVVQTYVIPGSTTGAGIVLPIPVGMAFLNGIAYCITGAVADNDNTSVAANEIVVNTCHK